MTFSYRHENDPIEEELDEDLLKRKEKLCDEIFIRFVVAHTDADGCYLKKGRGVILKRDIEECVDGYLGIK